MNQYTAFRVLKMKWKEKHSTAWTFGWGSPLISLWPSIGEVQREPLRTPEDRPGPWETGPGLGCRQCGYLERYGRWQPQAEVAWQPASPGASILVLTERGLETVSRGSSVSACFYFKAWRQWKTSIWCQYFFFFFFSPSSLFASLSNRVRST